jgi:hypothetical protein
MSRRLHTTADPLFPVWEKTLYGHMFGNSRRRLYGRPLCERRGGNSDFMQTYV